jgi:hypothetical protein
VTCIRRSLLTTFALAAALGLPSVRAQTQAEEGDWTINRLRARVLDSPDQSHYHLRSHPPRSPPAPRP